MTREEELAAIAKVAHTGALGAAEGLEAEVTVLIVVSDGDNDAIAWDQPSAPSRFAAARAAEPLAHLAAQAMTETVALMRAAIARDN